MGFIFSVVAWGKIDILLVDDKNENLLALEAVLSCPDYNLIKRNSGKEALKYLLNHDCAIILLDVQMPEMDGFETAHFIKQSERSRDIPIIFITAISTDERYVQFGYKSGAVDYIFKPFQPDILCSKVAIFADLYRSKMEIQRQADLLRESDKRDRERALAELELRSLRREQLIQNKYRDLVDSIQHAIIWSIDPVTSSFLFVSPSAKKILGYPLEQWTTQKEFWGRALHPADQELITRALNLCHSRENAEIEHRMLRADGKVLWFRTGMRLFPKSEMSDESELRGLSIDITPIKETDEALRQSEERAKLLAEAGFLLSQSLDYETTADQIAKIVVPRLADHYEIVILENSSPPHVLNFGHDSRNSHSLGPLAEDLVTRTQARALVEGGDSEFCPALDDFRASADTPETAHLKMLSRAGYVSALMVPLVTRGQVWGILILAYGPSQRRYQLPDLQIAEELATRIAVALENSRFFQQVQNAVKARDEFLSIASHELKTPLTPLRLHTQMMLKALKRDGDVLLTQPDKMHKMFVSADRQVQRLAQLVDDLLDISRINVGKLELKREVFDLSEMISDVAERFSEQLQQAQCHLELGEVQTAIGEWDRFRLEQVFINLLTNAIKYGAARPISVALSADDQWTRLTVTDQGIGIAKVDQDRIFQRFERAVSSTHFGGLGLGLYISNEIVKAHGGRIRVESDSGLGSSFHLELPRRPEVKPEISDATP